MTKSDNDKQKQFEVGGLVSSKCGACKTMTPHTIISLKANKPAQVCCSNCERFHKYRPAPQQPVAKTRKNPDLEEWTRMSPGWSEKKVLAYGTSKVFKVNDIVNHSRFGLGQVRQVLESRKMRVLFESGMKLMVCGK